MCPHQARAVSLYCLRTFSKKGNILSKGAIWKYKREAACPSFLSFGSTILTGAAVSLCSSSQFHLVLHSRSSTLLPLPFSSFNQTRIPFSPQCSLADFYCHILREVSPDHSMMPDFPVILSHST